MMMLTALAHPEPLFGKNDNLIAMVTNADVDLEIPRLKMEAIGELADLIEAAFL